MFGLIDDLIIMSDNTMFGLIDDLVNVHLQRIQIVGNVYAAIKICCQCIFATTIFLATMKSFVSKIPIATITHITYMDNRNENICIYN